LILSSRNWVEGESTVGESMVLGFRESTALVPIVSNPDGLLTDNSIQSNMIHDLRGEGGRSSKGRI
jgi:hypothetical protein